MTEVSIHSSLDLGSDIEESHSIYPNRSILATAIAYSNQNNPNPRNITEFAPQNQIISQIALNLQALLTADGAITYDLYTRKDILKIFCSFVEGVLKESSNSKETEVMNSNSSVSNSLNQKLATLQTESSKNNLETAQEKFETNLMISTQAAQIKSLKEKIARLSEENMNFTLPHDFQSTIQEKNETIDLLIQKVDRLKSKLSHKKETINKLQDAQNSDRLKIQNLQAKNDEYDALYKSKRISDGMKNNFDLELGKSQKKIADLSKTISAISSLYEKQATELIQINQTNQKAFELLNKQTAIINQFSTIATDNELKTQSLVKEVDELTTSNNDLRKRLEISEANRTFSEKILNEVQTQLNDYFKADIQNIPETLQVILAEGDPILKKKNRQLKQIVKGQINFLQHFAETGEIDILKLDPASTTKGQAVKESALTEISNCRRFMKENGLVMPEEFQKSEERHLSFQIAINEVLRKECEKSLETKNALKKLQVKFMVSDDVDFYQYLTNAAKFIHELLTILNIDNVVSDSEQIFQVIQEFIQQMSHVYNYCDTKLRNLIHFEGKTGDVPVACYDYIRKMKKGKSKEINTIKNDATELKSELDSSKNRINELEKALKAKEIENSNLKIENVNFSSEFENTKHNSELENSSLRSQNQILASQLQSANSKIQSLTHEQLNLQSQLDENQRDYQKQIKSSIQDEQFKATVALESFKSQTREEIAKLKEKLRLYAKRIQTLKQKNDELVKESTSTSEKQKEIIDHLNKQNEELQNEISTIQNDTSSNIKTQQDECRAIINSLQSEKRILKSEINGLLQRCNQIESAKDNYWKTQITNVEKKWQSKLIEEKDAVMNEHKEFLHLASASLARFVPMFGPVSDDGFVSYLEKVAGTIEEYETRLQQLQARFLRGDLEQK